jgi:hypothetical protein
MRLGQLFSMSLIVSGLLLSATGCVCMDGAGGCGPRGCSTGACQTGCDPCAGNGGFGAGGPLARLVGWEGAASGCDSCGGCKAGCGAGCGELYVDEWVNEPPTVDNCGCGECLTCGRQPVRSLLRLLWGDRYCGSCETGCDSGFDLMSPIVNDGYDPGAWSANRGCNCGGHASATNHVNNEAVEVSPVPGESIMPSPPVPVPNDSTTGNGPTLAPPVPKSAMRLNPATRRMAR